MRFVGERWLWECGERVQESLFGLSVPRKLRGSERAGELNMLTVSSRTLESPIFNATFAILLRKRVISKKHRSFRAPITFWSARTVIHVNPSCEAPAHKHAPMLSRRKRQFDTAQVCHPVNMHLFVSAMTQRKPTLCTWKRQLHGKYSVGSRRSKAPDVSSR